MLMSTTALLYLAVLLPGPRAPLWRAVPARPRPSVLVASADAALTAAMPPLPTREVTALASNADPDPAYGRRPGSFTLSLTLDY